MGKITVTFLFLVILGLCLAAPDRRGRRGRRDKQWWNQRGHDLFEWDFWKKFHRRFSGPEGLGFSTSRRPHGFSGEFRPFFSLDFNWGEGTRQEPWWKGPNVCFTRKEQTPDDDDDISSHVSYHSQVCDGSDTAFTCTTKEFTPEGRNTITETYECCPGFTRKQDDFGCPGEIELLNLAEMLERLELDNLISLLDSTGISGEIYKDETNNFTIFAPSNEGLEDLAGTVEESIPGVDLQDMGSLVMVSKQISETVVKDTRDILLGHVAVGRYTTPHLVDNTLIDTASPLKSKIRINTYQRPKKLITANCQKITNTDNIAKNGVVHVLKKSLAPVTDSLLDLVRKNPELSTLKTALGNSPLAADLREDGHYTLLAPTDTAFKKHEKLLKRLLSEPRCIEKVLRNHILPNVICSSVVSEKSKTPNLLDKYANLSRDADDKLYVDGAQIVSADVMGTNGVLHIIDELLLPDEALDLLDIAGQKGMTGFLDLVRKAGLKKSIESMENVTLFIPTNEAIQQLSSVDNSELETILQYHVVPGVHSSSRLYNNAELSTNADGAKLRFNEYSSYPFDHTWKQTIQCANLAQGSTKGCNGVFYIIDKVLIPPRGNVIDVLSQEKRFSTLMKLVKLAGIADTLQESGPFTVFAPTNKAFDNLGSDAVTELKDNPKLLKDLILSHVAADQICCAGVNRPNWLHTQRVRTMSGDVFPIKKNRHGNVAVDRTLVTECDITATNGVVHVIEEVIIKDLKPSWDWMWEF